MRVHPSLEFRETERSGRGVVLPRRADRRGALVRAEGPGAERAGWRGRFPPPDGAWPRVRAGVAAASPDAGKSWECVLARAVADAVAGGGGAFWANYGGVMPPCSRAPRCRS